MSDKPKIQKTDDEWRKILTPAQFDVLRNHGTERAFTGPYLESKEPGEYVCAGCGQALFKSDDKFDSGSGWPSFTRPAAEGMIDEKTDDKFGMSRTEILCSRCGGHLGHVFPDGPMPTGQRYCVNGHALKKK